MSPSDSFTHTELYGLYRTYMQHEDDLIHQRQTWNLTIQGFLFATYGFSLQKLAELDSRILDSPCVATNGLGACKTMLSGQQSITDLGVLILILPIVGFAVSLFAWMSIEAARWAIENFRLKWMAYRSANNGLAHLPILVGGGSKLAKVFGFYAPRLISFVFMCAWWYLSTNRINRELAWIPVGLVAALWGVSIIRYAIDTFTSGPIRNAIIEADRGDG